MNPDLLTDIQPADETAGLLVEALAAYRLGSALPVMMSQAASGELGRAMAQSFIRSRLTAVEHQQFVEFRDASRSAAALIRQGEPAAAKAFLAQLLLRCKEKNLPVEVSLLGQLWVTQAQAYAAVHTGDAEESARHTMEALEVDTLLEAEGYLLCHLHRLHLLHLRAKIEAGREELAYAVQLLEAASEYLAGKRADLPLGRSWEQQTLARVPLMLRDAMRVRLASEVGLILAQSDPRQEKELFQNFSSWRLGSERPGLLEVLAWGQFKEAFILQQWPVFLKNCCEFLRAGRRESNLWYAVSHDLYRFCQAFHPPSAATLRQELQQDVLAWEKLSPEIFSRRWARVFKAL